ncbi:hypothetical protein BRADI_4g02293v3 [Brachypodium distachyon]|uniref:Uncharacterized protein n=1 Tax=Brachypodium distachyon TaxID=15368 RepID=A0A2K2CJZ4_BRADI|nr:hypothetical protein BRADI_4g02293v3 [Brachypodium distachyon]
MAWHNASASTRSNLAAATSIVRQLDLRRIRRREAEHREVWAKPTPPCAGERSSAGSTPTNHRVGEDRKLLNRGALDDVIGGGAHRRARAEQEESCCYPKLSSSIDDSCPGVWG